jgi:hypothetical protein
MLIGVEIKTASKVVMLDALAWYCDRLWVTVVGKAKISGMAYVPEFVGILRVDGGKLKVERPAFAGPSSGLKSGEMAKELLPRVLQT